MNKSLFAVIALALGLALGACSNTWSGVKQDTKKAGQATGQAIEKTGQKIEEISK